MGSRLSNRERERERKKKKTGEFLGGLREEIEIEKEMYQKAFCPSPPRTTTSARLAANSTNYWLVVGENCAWQQLLRWPGLCVNTKIPLLLLINPPPYFVAPSQCSLSPTEAEEEEDRERAYVFFCL